MELLANGWNIVLILLGFGLLIFVHELGHFLAARWAGIRCESFAVGMGPVVLGYRTGIGWAAGSTEPATIARHGKAAVEMTDAELAQHGIGETEYSLRALPLGGFVRMLGQDDMDPGKASTDVRSYQRTPVWKRMIVVSAGVASNLVLAVVLFVAVFLVGVRFQAPVVGDVAPGSAAAEAIDSTAGLKGLQPGDRILRAGGRNIETFDELMVAGAMAEPDAPMEIAVRRGAPGAERELAFVATPRKDKATGLLALGVGPAGSVTLAEPPREVAAIVAGVFEEAGLAKAGVGPRSMLLTVAGTPVDRWEQIDPLVGAMHGAPVPTTWRLPDGREAAVTLRVDPAYQAMRGEADDKGARELENGLFGLVPLVRIREVPAGSQNAGTLRAGDVVLRAAGTAGPRMVPFREELARRKGATVELEVLRDGAPVAVTATVDGAGKLNVGIGYAWDVPMVAQPMAQLAPATGAAATGTARPATEASPAAAQDLPPLATLTAVGGVAVSDWRTLRAALLAATQDAAARGQDAQVAVAATSPAAGHAAIAGTLPLAAADVRALHALGWRTALEEPLFEPLMVTLTANGDPLRAVEMGFRQTKTMVTMTYLTLDRILRGSVGVEQLRGPVGIVHLGTRVADRGATYLVCFLAMISVNLAVLNFLPLPIVDGGLFLYLVYERLTGRAPSAGFQNGAALVGLCLLGGLFLFTFYNDVMRLVTGG
jgi:regulator of sigma E protease